MTTTQTPKIILDETIDLKTGEISKLPVKTLEERIKDLPSTSVDQLMKAELLTLVEEAHWMAKVLSVYRNKRNWTRMWNNQTSGYNWHFHAGETKGRETMAPDMLMDAIADGMRGDVMNNEEVKSASVDNT